MILKHIKTYPRYSKTSEPDDKGRWARLVFFKEKVLIAWIHGLTIDGKIVKYSTSLYFPINTNDMPHGVESFDTYEEAFEYVISKWNWFKYLIED